MTINTRREFSQKSIIGGTAFMPAGLLSNVFGAEKVKSSGKNQYGLVTVELESSDFLNRNNITMRLSYILSFILFCTLGCDNSTPKPNDPPSNTETKNTPPNPFANATTFKQEKIEAKIASWKDVQKFVKLQTGKIVVIDIWSTWCDPCMREYPHLVALQKKYPKQVVCLSFNVNYDGIEDSPPESNKQDIMEFLVKQDSQLTNIISNIASDDFYDATDIGAIPVVYVYKANGTINKIFQDSKEYGQEGFSYKKHITPLVDKLVSELKE